MRERNVDTASLEKQNGVAEPRQEARRVPNGPFIADIFKHVQNNPHVMLFIDEIKGLAVTRQKMLRDILSVSDKLFKSFNEEIEADIRHGEVDVSICILIPSSYEFLVTFLALVALGAAAVPLR